MSTISSDTPVNQGKPSATAVWMRKLSAWVDGGCVSASKGTLRMSGDVIIHKDTGDRQALRLGDGHILYRARGVAESANPTNFQVNRHFNTIGEGVESSRKYGRQSDGNWGFTLTEWTWAPPSSVEHLIPVPGILLTLSTVRPMSPDLVDLGTRLEWTRVQAVIKSRSKNIRADGHMGYFTANLANNSQDSDRVYYWTVNIYTLNKVRALFGLDRLPTYESPIDGLSLGDFKNLHALAAS